MPCGILQAKWKCDNCKVWTIFYSPMKMSRKSGTCKEEYNSPNCDEWEIFRLYSS